MSGGAMESQGPQTDVTPKCPDNEADDTLMSNFDHTIDPEIERKLMDNPNALFARHAGWNFNAKCWWDGAKWRSEVWHYGAIADRMTADTARELMELHNERWGGA